MAGNPSFDGSHAFVIEDELTQEWSNVFSEQWPLLAMIRAKDLRFNKALKGQNGQSMILPIIYLGPTTGARNRTNANAFTPVTPNATVGFTQAEYNYAFYENAYYLTGHELALIGDPKTTRIPIEPGKIIQLVDQFKDAVTTDILGTQNGTGATGNGQNTGLQYILATGNSPGGIPQATYAKWQAGVVNNAGSFYEGLIDAEIDRINALRKGADFVQLSYASTNDVYGKFYGLIAPSQVITKEGPGKVSYGFETFEYRGLDCFMDKPLGTALAGSVVVGSSKSWWVNMDSEAPQFQEKTRLPGTPSNEYWYDWGMCWGNNDPALNTLISGVTP